MNFAKMRQEMCESQLLRRGISDPGVLKAMNTIPREHYIPIDMIHLAYRDGPVPIDCGQTISQPFIVAYMCEALRLKKSDRVLEIGTGSAYNAAILSQLCNQVHTLEINPILAKEAMDRLRSEGINNVYVHQRSGGEGLAEYAPYDAIILTAAPTNLPKILLDQLKNGGRLIAPLGDSNQYLYLFQKNLLGEIQKTLLFPVRFVPMTWAIREKPVSTEDVQ